MSSQRNPNERLVESAVTIDDVARLAGVSVATVSRALRGLPNVAEATAARVRRAASDLGYLPAPAAAALATGKTRTIALAVPVLNSWYFSQVMAGVERVVGSSPYDLLIVAMGADEPRRRLLGGLLRRADGLVLADVYPNDDEWHLLEPRTSAVVTLDFEVEGRSAVMVDNVRVGEVATQHLVDLGHRRIALLAGDPVDRFNFVVPERRLDGYRRTLEVAGLPVDGDLVVHGYFSLEGGRAAMHRLMELPDPPTAVFAMSDEMALGALRALGERGLSAPSDVSVVGVDGHEVADIVGLTTVRQRVFEHGEFAAQLLLEHLAREDLPPRRVMPAVDLVERSSSAPLPEDGNVAVR